MAEKSKGAKPRTGGMTLLTFAASFLCLVMTYKISGRTHGVIILWPLTAVQLAFLLSGWKAWRERLLGQAAGAAATFLGAVVSGLPPWFALSIVCASTADVWIAGSILSRGVLKFDDLKRRDNLLTFVTAATMAPVLSSLINAWPLAQFLGIPLLRAYPLSVLCDSLGIAIVFPTLLFLLTGSNRKPARLKKIVSTGAPAALFFTAVTMAVFWQTTGPFLFLIFPAMVLIVLVTGLEGSLYVALILSSVASIATTHGHGPLWLARTGTYEHRLLLLQMFLWMTTATSLPVGALLDEWRASERAASESRLIYRTLLQNAEHMMILSSLDGEQRFVSSACERLTGWTPVEFAAKDRAETFHPEDRHLAEQAIDSLIKGNREHSMRYRIALKRGGYRWVDATARAYFDDRTMALRGYVVTIRLFSEMRESTGAPANQQTPMAIRPPSQNGKREVVEGPDGRTLFDNALLNQSLAARINHESIGVILLNLDFFKSYNDTYGVLRGDECLRAVCNVLTANVGRANDLVVRWGEAFRVLLPGAGLPDTDRIAKKMLEEVRALRIEHSASPLGYVTASAGAAVSNHQSLGDPKLVVQHAEQALGLSQQAGRDRVTIAQSAFHLDQAGGPSTQAADYVPAAVGPQGPKPSIDFSLQEAPGRFAGAEAGSRRGSVPEGFSHASQTAG